MNKLLIGVGLFFIILSLTLPANGAPNKQYWIDDGREVLAFIGDPDSLQTVVAKLTTFGKQKINLMHKKSGPGLYAFNLKGLEVKDELGQMIVIDMNGFFVAKKRWVRASKYKVKTSLKGETK